MTMKIAPVSGDLLVKLGLGVVAFGGLAMLIYTWKSQASAAAGAAANAVDYINPNSTQNAVYQSVNGFWGTVLPDGAPGMYPDGQGGTDFSLGGAVYDILHPSEWSVFRPSPPSTTPVRQAGPYVDAMGNYYN